MSTSSPDTDVLVTAKPKEREKTSASRQPPYHVILENDDHHSMEFVVEVLLKVLGCTPERAIQFMLTAHQSGRAVVWTGTREVAELKVEQILTFHETRENDGAKLGPLGCSIEPAPGS